MRVSPGYQVLVGEARPTFGFRNQRVPAGPAPHRSSGQSRYHVACATRTLQLCVRLAPWMQTSRGRNPHASNAHAGGHPPYIDLIAQNWGWHSHSTPPPPKPRAKATRPSLDLLALLMSEGRFSFQGQIQFQSRGALLRCLGAATLLTYDLLLTTYDLLTYCLGAATLLGRCSTVSQGGGALLALAGAFGPQQAKYQQASRRRRAMGRVGPCASGAASHAPRLQ